LLQRKIAFEVTSVPLSETVIRSFPRHAVIVVSSRARRLPEIDVSGTEQRPTPHSTASIPRNNKKNGAVHDNKNDVGEKKSGEH
jgi:hypothetical protein